MKWLAIALYVFFFAFFAGVMVLGIAMYLSQPDPALATASVEYIMRDVEGQWLRRYSHSLLSGLFIFVSLGYLVLVSIFQQDVRAIYAAILFLLLLGVEYFFGFFLPWGESSFVYVPFAHAIVIPLLLVATSTVVVLLMRKAHSPK